MSNKAFFSFLAVVAVGLVIFLTVSSQINKLQKQTSNQKQDILSNIAPMQLSSSAFSSNGNIPRKYTCEGDGINPPLLFKDVPEGAKTLAVIVDDPDAPTSTWVHWLVWNIDASTKGIAENMVPSEAIQGVTDFGQRQYGGPCPPSGMHHYSFRLYALDTGLNLSSFANKAALEKAMEGHILARAELIGLYKKY